MDKKSNGVLVIRLADDCGVCIHRKATGQIDSIVTEVSKIFTVPPIQEVKQRMVGDPNEPDLFNFPKFTPYFMFMLKPTYDYVMENNPPVEEVIHDVRLYNWIVNMDGELVKSESYERFFGEMTRFCNESYNSLAGVRSNSHSVMHQSVSDVPLFPRKPKTRSSAFRG
jgi:hypothetical protein